MAEVNRFLTETDSGRVISLSPGEFLELMLTGNPTSGYEWEIGSYEDTFLRQVEKPAFIQNSPLTGSGGFFRFRFQAVATGHTILRLVYHRPFDDQAKPLREFMITVLISTKA